MQLLIRMAVFACFTLSVAALITIVVKSQDLNQQIYAVDQKNQELAGQIATLRGLSNKHQKLIDQLFTTDEEAQALLEAHEAKIDILDTSMHPDKKRRQRLLQARDAILEHLHDGKSLQACGSKLDPWTVYRMAGWFVDYTDRYGVDLSLALAVARRESMFCQRAVSKAGAVGTMQIMGDTADDLSERIGVKLSRHKTQDNIRMGVYYLGLLTLEFKGNTELAVKSYNMGPHNVKKVLVGELSDYFSETKEYWEYVSLYQQDFKEMGL